MPYKLASESKPKPNIDPIMGDKKRWYAAINGLNYAGSIDPGLYELYKRIGVASDNHGERSVLDIFNDRCKLEERIRIYLKKLDGLQLTISISDIASDLHMTEEAVVKILEEWQMNLDEQEEV